MRPAYVLATALAALPLAATPAAAQQTGVKVGYLTCSVQAGYGFVFGSSRDVNCVYAPVNGPSENYTGEINRWGVDIGYLQAATVLWGVVAPTQDLGPGALAGTYTGVGAEATVGVGVGANALIGGNNQQVALQPISIEGTEGLNLAAGIAQLTLVPASGG